MSGNNPPPIDWDNLVGLEEMVENLAGIKGYSYARFVGAIFSIGNIHATYQIAMAHLVEQAATDELKEAGREGNQLLKEAWSSQMNAMISAFAEIVLRADPNWSTYCQEEKFDKLRRYVDNMRKDAMMLVEKQSRGRSQ